MADYVVLCKLTQEGAKQIGGMHQMVQEKAAAPANPGIKVVGSYLMFGAYDWIFLLEGPDDETIARMVLALVGTGLCTTETMRAFDPKACERLLAGGG